MYIYIYIFLISLYMYLFFTWVSGVLKGVDFSKGISFCQWGHLIKLFYFGTFWPSFIDNNALRATFI